LLFAVLINQQDLAGADVAIRAGSGIYFALRALWGSASYGFSPVLPDLEANNMPADGLIFN
jgi:hypothetical protein